MAWAEGKDFIIFNVARQFLWIGLNTLTPMNTYHLALSLVNKSGSQLRAKLAMASTNDFEKKEIILNLFRENKIFHNYFIN